MLIDTNARVNYHWWMRRYFVIGLAGLALYAHPSASLCFGQGQVVFNNRVTGAVDARFLLPDGTGVGAGFTAQLFAGPAGSQHGS